MQDVPSAFTPDEEEKSVKRKYALLISNELIL